MAATSRSSCACDVVGPVVDFLAGVGGGVLERLKRVDRGVRTDEFSGVVGGRIVAHKTHRLVAEVVPEGLAARLDFVDQGENLGMPGGVLAGRGHVVGEGLHGGVVALGETLASRHHEAKRSARLFAHGVDREIDVVDREI